MFLLDQLDDYASRLQSAIEKLRLGYLEATPLQDQWRDRGWPYPERLEDIEWNNTGAYEALLDLAIGPMTAFADLLHIRLMEFIPLEGEGFPPYVEDYAYRANELAGELKRRISDWSFAYSDIADEIYRESQFKKPGPMRQYLSIKAQYPDHLLLFKVNGEHCCFFEDAKIAAKILGLQISKAGTFGEEPVVCVAIPNQEVRESVKRLVAEGKKVVICDRVDDPDNPKPPKKTVIRTMPQAPSTTQ